MGDLLTAEGVDGVSATRHRGSLRSERTGTGRRVSRTEPRHPTRVERLAGAGATNRRFRARQRRVLRSGAALLCCALLCRIWLYRVKSAG
jgi:hypothetical protein